MGAATPRHPAVVSRLRPTSTDRLAHASRSTYPLKYLNDLSACFVKTTIGCDYQESGTCCARCSSGPRPMRSAAALTALLVALLATVQSGP